MPDSRYLVKAVVQAWKVLAAFQPPGEALRLRDIAARTGLLRGTAFRLLYTLRECGLVEKLGDNTYRARVEPLGPKRFRVGYARNGKDQGFTRIVTESLSRSMEEAGMELLILDNHADPKLTMRNAEHFVKERVQLAIEFQGDESLAPALSEKLLSAGVPMIAIDVPHPGATYFGANNYGAGLIGGRYMARWVKEHWQGEVEEILLIQYARAGSLPHSRLTGLLAGLKENLPSAERAPVYEVDGDGNFQSSLGAVRKHIRRTPAGRKTLAGAMNDPCALGALRAFEESGRANDCAVMGQNAEPEAREELRRPHTRLIGSVAYFPERYGAGLVRLALDILVRKSAPPASFIRHRLITPGNVDHHYPHDALIGIGS